MTPQTKNDRTSAEQPRDRGRQDGRAAECSPDRRNEPESQTGLRHQEHELKKGDNGGLVRDI